MHPEKLVNVESVIVAPSPSQNKENNQSIQITEEKVNKMMMKRRRTLNELFNFLLQHESIFINTMIIWFQRFKK